MQKIGIAKALEMGAHFIDTRSPAEYALDHIPEAQSMPIFSNQERHDIGILYKEDRDAAFDKGVEYYTKKLPNLVKILRSLDKQKPVVIYCWRGGMRSKAITQLAELLGLNVHQLSGGYKKYRKFIIDQLQKPLSHKFIVLYGSTGVGKTELLKELQPSIDLEDLAQHRSSLFGEVGMQSRSQKHFESLLHAKLKELESAPQIFIEGESRRIGKVLLPESVYTAMKRGVKFRITAPLQQRINRIVEEYGKEEYEVTLLDAINKLKPTLGTPAWQKLTAWVQEKAYKEVAEFLLTKHYDPTYERLLSSITYNATVGNTKEEITAALQTL